MTGGMCLELRGPVAVIGSAIANGAGVASLQLTLPSSVPSGLTVHVQAAAVRGPGGSLSVRSPAIRRITGAAPPASIGVLVPGDLVLTEILQDPTVVADAVGEWFEVENRSGVDVDLAGLEISDGGADRFVVPRSLLVTAGGRAVLGASDDPAVNGGIAVDQAWTGLSLGDGADALGLFALGTLVDEVAWDDGAAFPDPAGQSMSLDPRHTSSVDNDDGGLWCAAAGTPGAPNGLCPLPVCGDGAVDPGEACDDGGTASGDGCDASCQLEVCALPVIPTGEWVLSQPGYPALTAAEGPDGDLYLSGPGWTTPYANNWFSRVDGGTLTAEWTKAWHNTTVPESVPWLLPRADGGMSLFTTLYATSNHVITAATVDAAGGSSTRAPPWRPRAMATSTPVASRPSRTAATS